MPFSSEHSATMNAEQDNREVEEFESNEAVCNISNVDFNYAHQEHLDGVAMVNENTDETMINNNHNLLTLRIQESSGRLGLTTQAPTRVTVSKTDTVATLKHCVLKSLLLAANKDNDGPGGDGNSHSSSNAIFHTSTTTSNNNSINFHNNYYVRLIAAGRLLTPDASLLTQWQLIPEQVIHAVVVLPLPPPPPPPIVLLPSSSSSLLAGLPPSHSVALPPPPLRHYPPPLHNPWSYNDDDGVEDFESDDDDDWEEDHFLGTFAAAHANRTDDPVNNFNPEEEEDDSSSILDDNSIYNNAAALVATSATQQPLSLPLPPISMSAEQIETQQQQQPHTARSSTRQTHRQQQHRRRRDRPLQYRNSATTTATHSNSTTGNYNRRGLNARGRAVMGFDRLRGSARLNRTEIAIVRLHFNPQIDAWLLQQPSDWHEHWQAQEPVDTLRRRRLQEDAWMLAQGPLSEFRLNILPLAPSTTATNAFGALSQARYPWDTSATAGQHPSDSTTITTLPLFRNTPTTSTGGSTTAASIAGVRRNPVVQVGTDRDFCWGFFLGFFVGFFMLLWVWMPTVPHKQKLGILTGYSFHLALGMFQAGDAPSRNASSTAGLANHHNDPEAYYGDDVMIWSE